MTPSAGVEQKGLSLRLAGANGAATSEDSLAISYETRRAPAMGPSHPAPWHLS